MNSPVEYPAARKIEQGFELATLRIDPRSGAASGPGGVEKLDPKVMAVLVMLAQNAGQVVLRADLFERLWPGVVVNDEALSRCIYELRRQLSLAGGNEDLRLLIETLPKRGYRLNGEVMPLSDEATPAGQAEQRRSWAWALAGIAVAIVAVVAWRITQAPSTVPGAAGYSIAVLPFVDMSQAKDQAYLADGISEEILNRLAQSKDVRVIARTSSFALRDSGLDVAEIANRLQVTHVLEGSVRKSGDTVRVTAQLIAAADSSHVWSDTYDRRIPDLLAVQDEIAVAVTTALEITLSGNFARPRPPASAEAYEKFLQANFFFYRRAPGDIERAISYYEQAVEIDPRFARAWAGLAGAYSYLAFDESGHGPASLVEKQKQAALRAVELDPNLAIAHARLAHVYEVSGEYAKSDEHTAKARALDPDEPLVLTHAISEAVEHDDLSNAIELQRGIVARDPLAGVLRSNLAVLLLADSQYEEALSQFRKVQEIHPEGEAGVSNEIALTLVLLRRFDEAELEAAKVPTGEARDQVMVFLYAATGREPESDAALARLLVEQDEVFDTIRIAEAKAYRGNVDEAFASLQESKQALTHEHGTKTAHVWYLKNEARLSPFLRVLRTDSRWSAFLADPRTRVTE